LRHLQNLTEIELKQLYASSDVLVHPSTGEGITLAVMECLSTGTPVVISNESIRGADEQTRQLFFPVEPDTLEIESALIGVLSKASASVADLREECRRYALSRVSWKHISAQYVDLLKSIAR